MRLEIQAMYESAQVCLGQVDGPASNISILSVLIIQTNWFGKRVRIRNIIFSMVKVNFTTHRDMFAKTSL